MTKYVLPDLPYDYGALEPHVSGRILQLHHDKHHRNYVTTANETIMGSGWAALVFDPVSRRLGTTQILDHQCEVTQAGIPLLVIDAWEHAYYLQYFNEKAKFFAALWNVWNWADVARRYELSQK